MAGGDPVDEGGQAVRTGFVQAMQTAAMTMNLLQRRGAESRSVAEFDRRTAESELRAQQDRQIHQLKVEGYHTRHDHEGELHQLDKHLKVRQMQRADADFARRAAESQAARADSDEIHALQKAGYAQRDQRAEELRELERAIKSRILERGEAEFERRSADAATERANKDEIHSRQHQLVLDRAVWEKQRHDLDVEYKQLLIDIRRRAAGFSETLTAGEHDYSQAMRSAAAYAAATGTADLSEQHRAAAHAYGERFAEDTGAPWQEMVADAAQPAADVIDAAGSWLDAVAGLTEELTFEMYANHLGASTTEERTGDVDPGSLIEHAVEAAGLTDDFGESLAPEATQTAPGPQPWAGADAGVEP